MFRNNFKSHFIFTRSEQGGIVFLSCLLLMLMGIHYYLNFQETASWTFEDEQLRALQKEMDSLRCVKSEQQKPTLYPFNPNFISQYKAYTLGMSGDQFFALQQFRDENNWIRSKSQFQKITGVDSIWLDSIGPYFRFPTWERKTKNKPKTRSFSELSFHEKTDLNNATAEELQKISGIGTVLSQRIVDYREKLDGFSDDSQLYFVYGLDAKVVDETLKQFTVKTPKEIKKMNVNIVSASDIATIPGISFELAKKIWEYVRLRDGIEDVSELTKFEELSTRQFGLIKLYLSANE